MSEFDRIKEAAARQGPLCGLNTQQAAAVLNMSESTLRKHRETKMRAAGGEARIPFQTRGGKAVYALTDLLEYAKRHNSNGLTLAQRTLALLMGEEFCDSIGEPWPGPRSAPREEKRAEPPAPAPFASGPPGLAEILGLGVAPVTGTPRKRGPKPMGATKARTAELERLGARVRTNLCRFASMQDFLLNAEPEEEWLFCVPPSGRPYDFMRAVFGEQTDAPFKWMSLAAYLAAVSERAVDDRDARIAEEERVVLENNLEAAGGGSR